MQAVKRDSPSYHRNIDPISEAFKRLFPTGQCNVLEIGSGSGQHVASLARQFPDCRFYPTEVLATDLPGIDEWTSNAGRQNIEKAQTLDVTHCPWELQSSPASDGGFDVMFCLNVIHIAPWEVTEKLFEGASGVLNPNAKAFLYGPFKQGGEHTSPSNSEFDLWLKAKDPRFGVRDLDAVSQTASQHGFQLQAAHQMPANNFIVEFSLTGI